VWFVNGFHRSGTTVVAAAATEASDGATLTVGRLARRICALDRLLRSSPLGGAPVDRGVDRLPVTESTPEEYGWLLHHVTGQYTFRDDGACVGILRELIAELSAGSGPGAPDRPSASSTVVGKRAVVLKNPWDTGRERLLLDTFPGARVLLVRRRLAAVEDSVGRALARYVTSDGYLRALTDDRAEAGKLLAALTDSRSRAVVVFLARWRLRIGVFRLARRVSGLPGDRVAFVCYDELRRDPRAGAAWASHLLDADAFAESFAKLAFEEHSDGPRGGWVTRFLDWYWARAWRRARAAQVAATTTRRSP
jgi:hypothetical protein